MLLRALHTCDLLVRRSRTETRACAPALHILTCCQFAAQHTPSRFAASLPRALRRIVHGCRGGDCTEGAAFSPPLCKRIRRGGSGTIAATRCRTYSSTGAGTAVRVPATPCGSVAGSSKTGPERPSGGCADPRAHDRRGCRQTLCREQLSSAPPSPWALTRGLPSR